MEKQDTGDTKVVTGKPDDTKPIHFKVNGTELVSKSEKLTALDILKLAKEKGAFSGAPTEYALGDAGGDRKYQPGDQVTLSADKEFLAVRIGQTSVA